MQRLGIQRHGWWGDQSVHIEQCLPQRTRIAIQFGCKAHGMACADPLQDLGFQGLDDQDIHVTCGSAPARHAIRCVPQ
jgi:hypothetical protein